MKGNNTLPLFASLTGTTPESILGTSRKREIVDARHMYWLLLHKSGLSYSTIARMVGKNPATVLHGVKRMNMFIEIGDKWARTAWDVLKGNKESSTDTEKVYRTKNKP